jgi:hypothetical protein
LLNKIGQETAGIKLTVKKADIVECTNPGKLIETYKVQGGPSPAEVERAITSTNKTLTQTKTNITQLKANLANAENTLNSTVESHSQSESSRKGKLKNSKS